MDVGNFLNSWLLEASRLQYDKVFTTAHQVLMHLFTATLQQVECTQRKRNCQVNDDILQKRERKLHIFLIFTMESSPLS